jgi:hypothetical protein
MLALRQIITKFCRHQVITFTEWDGKSSALFIGHTLFPCLFLVCMQTVGSLFPSFPPVVFGYSVRKGPFTDAVLHVF